MEQITARKQLNGTTRVDMEEYFDDVEVENLYQWIDRIPLSRPKKNIGKDFSDAVCAAELVRHYFPRMVDVHNYSPASATKQKMENWWLFNRKVLKKLDLDLSEDVIRALAQAKPRVIEKVLMLLRLQIDKFLEKSAYYNGELKMWVFPELQETPPGNRSPRAGGEGAVRSSSPHQRLIKSEPLTARSKYAKGEIPHSHPDRSTYWKTMDGHWYRHYYDRHYLPDIRPFIVPATDNIPRVLYEEKEMECYAKEETIKILNAKIRRLEHLLHLKDIRIEDLQQSFQAPPSYANKKR